MVSRKRLHVGRGDVRGCGAWRASQDVPVGTRERLPMGRVYVQECGEGRTT